MATPLSPRSRIRGVTLVELMVGLTIGLILVIIASSVYLYSKQSYNAVSENSQMEENGRFALDLLSKYIQSAGFTNIDPASTALPAPLAGKIRGCDLGYANATAPTTLSDLACRSATPAGERRSASIFMRAETDAYASSTGKQQGFGCTNEAAASKVLSVTGTNTYEARSYFFVSRVAAQTPYGTKTMGQLSCVSESTSMVDDTPGATVALQVQPLVPGIEQLAVGYISATGQVSGAPTTEAGWNNVTAIELCVLVRTIQASGNDTSTQYIDCYDEPITPGPSESYRTLRSTVALRNTPSP